MTREARTKNPNGERWLILCLVALATCVRIPGIAASFYGDEEFSLLRDSNQWLTSSEDRFRPVYFTLLYFWRQLGFHGEFGLRGLSLLFGVLQIPVAFKLGKRLEGPRAGLVFALLVALNPLLIEFSQEMRMYSLMPLIALLQAWAFAEVVERTAAGKPTLGAWAAFVATGVIGVYTHFHYWFLLVGFGVAALRRYRELPLKQSLVALAAVLALYLPNLPNLMRFQREGASGAHLLATDLPSALPKLLAAFCFGFNYFTLPEMGIDRAIRVSALAPNLGLAALAGVPTIAIGWGLSRSLAKRSIGPALWMSFELCLVPAVVCFVAVAVTGRNFIHPKYMVFSAPFFSLFLSAAYLGLPRGTLRTAVAVSGIVVLGVAFVHFNQPEKYGRREDWRGAAVLLRNSLDDQSVVLFLGNQYSPERLTVNRTPKSIWEYYAADLFPRIRLVRMPPEGASKAELASAVERETHGKREIYYIWSEVGRNFVDPDDRMLSTARLLFGSERVTRLNPRFMVYHWSAN